MNDVVTTIGYHGTTMDNAINILKVGFVPKKNKKHYLGQGSYFFSDCSDAKLYIKADDGNFLCYGSESAIIQSKIMINDSNYLDLDYKPNLMKFDRYVTEKIEGSEKTGKKIVLCSGNKAEDELLLTYSLIDLYKTINNFFVVSKTFAKSAPSYSSHFKRKKTFWGYQYLERYICVTCNDYMFENKIIYSNKNYEEMIL